MNIQPFHIEKPWGGFWQFCQHAPVTVKILSIKPNEQLSLQTHAKREEFWRILSGHGIVQVAEDHRDVQVGDEVTVPLGAKHRLSAGPKGLEVLEIASGDFDEEDIIRYEDSYGRV